MDITPARIIYSMVSVGTKVVWALWFQVSGCKFVNLRYLRFWINDFRLKIDLNYNIFHKS